jgi:hypothetical protein
MAIYSRITGVVFLAGAPWAWIPAGHVHSDGQMTVTAVLPSRPDRPEGRGEQQVFTCHQENLNQSPYLYLA